MQKRIAAVLLVAASLAACRHREEAKTAAPQQETKRGGLVGLKEPAKSEPPLQASAAAEAPPALAGVVVNVPELMSKRRSEVESIIGKPDASGDAAPVDPRQPVTVKYTVNWHALEVTYRDEKAETFRMKLNAPAGSPVDALRAFNLDVSALNGGEGDVAKYTLEPPGQKGVIHATARKTANASEWTDVEAEGVVQR